MLNLIFLLIAIICLLLLVLFLLDRLGFQQRAETENRELHELLEKQFLMQEDSLEAYRELLDAACREKGFWENAATDEDEETGDY